MVGQGLEARGPASLYAMMARFAAHGFPNGWKY